MVGRRLNLGSSPLARGLLLRQRRNTVLSRIIPARAGFTGIGFARRSTSPDHPRSRGVYRLARRLRAFSRGSSPLARGLRGLERLVGRERGIIPARAGFTLRRCHPWYCRRDHPRSRGVYVMRNDVLTCARGSSPLARGLPVELEGSDCCSRIIPARAGFTRRSRASVMVSRDHPRSRGVYLLAAPSPSSSAGSSPLARGLLIREVHRLRLVRIIPARAGFTSSLMMVSLPSRDHPRSRGVYPRADVQSAAVPGSSPLARGLRGDPVQAGTQAGIIPARAGFTVSSAVSVSVVADHPRSRGVYSSPFLSSPSSDGSSPLARGLRLPVMTPV
mgnify:CR=1 FL=1